MCPIITNQRFMQPLNEYRLTVLKTRLLGLVLNSIFTKKILSKSKICLALIGLCFISSKLRKSRQIVEKLKYFPALRGIYISLILNWMSTTMN